MRVPATRLVMANRSVGPVKTFTIGAMEKSGRLTCMPFRKRPAACSSTVTHGISGSRVRGCGRCRAISSQSPAIRFRSSRLIAF
jgi:hypothetical protein